MRWGEHRYGAQVDRLEFVGTPVLQYAANRCSMSGHLSFRSLLRRKPAYGSTSRSIRAVAADDWMAVDGRETWNITEVSHILEKPGWITLIATG